MGRLLQEIPREELAAWLLSTAKVVPDFGKRLNLYVARHSPADVALAQYRATLETLVKSRNRNPRKRASEAAQRFDGLIVSLAAEFEAGRMEVVMAVCVDGLRVLDNFLTDNDDPQKKLQTLIDELMQLHFMAATEWRPPQRELAMELVAYGQDLSATGAFRDAAYVYRDVLGDTGLNWYRVAMEPYWEDLRKGTRMSWHQKEQIKGQMLAWARAQEDPVVRAKETGRIVAALAYSAADCLQAAKSLLRAREEAEAMAAAEKGFAIAMRSPYSDDSLFELAILRMEKAKPEAAVGIAWQVFHAKPDAESYGLLQQAAVFADAELEYWARAVERLREIGSAWRPATPAAT